MLKLAASANIIEMPVDRSSLRFYHQLLQEYFAARELLKRINLPRPLGEGRGEGLEKLWRWPWLEVEMSVWVRPKDNYDPLPPPPPTGWEETTLLAAGLAPENDNQLVWTLSEINPVLAGRCLYEGQARVDKTTRQRVIETLLATIARPEVALRVRIAAGEVLGYLGDPRLGELVLVPAGKFLMGKGEEQHSLFLPDYGIGKYPLTNVEYGRFIEAGGYREKRWWTEAGWQEKGKPTYEEEPWTEPRLWNNSRFNKPNQPVGGVSWYEGVAYCRWWSAETGQNYRLPSEAEWEKAARGVKGWQYPWGNKFEAGRLNASEVEQQVRATTPVGIYPTGVSPLGAFDCAGNIWEWCATKWEKSYPYNLKEKEWATEYLEADAFRVLRGGSFYNNQLNARCACRGGNFPGSGDFDVGFRVVVFPISLPSSAL